MVEETNLEGVVAESVDQLDESVDQLAESSEQVCCDGASSYAEQLPFYYIREYFWGDKIPFNIVGAKFSFSQRVKITEGFYTGFTGMVVKVLDGEEYLYQVWFTNIPTPNILPKGSKKSVIVKESQLELLQS